jgi:hypothetical protein
MSEDETILIGWDSIGRVFGKSGEAIRKRKPEFLQYNVIFFMRFGRPPRRRVCAFPSRLKKYVILKTQNGEYF